MQEEVNQKVVSLSIRTGKLTANVLAKAMKMFLDIEPWQDGSFHPFHVYSMRQAIEEGFIIPWTDLST